LRAEERLESTFTVIASEREATQLMVQDIARWPKLHFTNNHQLGCFAFVTQNDSQDRFVRFAERSSPRNDG